LDPDTNLSPEATSTQRDPGHTFATVVGKQENCQVEPLFESMNVLNMRQEIKVEFDKINGHIFRGSITPQEAKHIIFKHCFKLNDFTIFDGVRCNYKGIPVATAIIAHPIFQFQEEVFKTRKSMC
jgi:hypothetical protein